MSFEADSIVDRRRLRRKVSFWRFLAFAVLILAVLGVGAAFARRNGMRLAGPHIARVTISGLITGDKDTLKLLDDVGQASSVSAVVLAIDSPGGTVTGSEKLHDSIRALVAKKPTVAVVDGIAASGAYIAAIGADHIVSHGSSLVGSIGVIAQYPNVTKLLDTLGVSIESIRSTPIKALPNGIEPTPPAARAALEATVADSYGWFKQLVKDRRGLTEPELATVSDGRVWTGRLALPLKLIDELGGEKEGVAWLERERGVAKSLSVRDWKPTPERGRFDFTSMAAVLAERGGLPTLAALLRVPALGVDAAALDGLLSIWQPASQN